MILIIKTFKSLPAISNEARQEDAASDAREDEQVLEGHWRAVVKWWGR